jgi:hypothetical protein
VRFARYLSGLSCAAAACLLGIQNVSFAHAAEPKQTSSQRINEQKLELMRRPDGSFSGAGWERLLEDSTGAQFTMVGEQHGAASIIEFATALQKSLAARGYSHAALEIGPNSTTFAEELIRQRPSALTDYISRPGYGFTFAFLFFAEEVRLAEQMVSLSPDRVRSLWGLDQEFVGSAPITAELLARRAQTPAQQDAVRRFREQAAQDKFFVGTIKQADLAQLESAFASEARASALVKDLRTSNSIYEPFLKQSPVYHANLTRENLMKNNFQVAFDAAMRRNGRAPRVFLKFGGNHAMRGHSATDVPSLANFLMEWGLGRGYRLVNVMVDCEGGEVLDPQTLTNKPCERYFPKDTQLADALRSGPSYQMVDLRPLRAQLARWTDVDPKTRQLVLAFDYYVLIRNVRAAAPTVGKSPH